jgi:amino acid transporter
MVTYLPIASPFIRLGGFWVDDAWGFAMGWNYFFLMGKYQCLGLCIFSPSD